MIAVGTQMALVLPYSYTGSMNNHHILSFVFYNEKKKNQQQKTPLKTGIFFRVVKIFLP